MLATLKKADGCIARFLTHHLTHASFQDYSLTTVLQSRLLCRPCSLCASHPHSTEPLQEAMDEADDVDDDDEDDDEFDDDEDEGSEFEDDDEDGEGWQAVSIAVICH